MGIRLIAFDGVRLVQQCHLLADDDDDKKLRSRTYIHRSHCI